MKSLCVFCGSSFGKNPEFKRSAESMGILLARRGITLIYGGGNVGLMGTIADATLAHSGKVIGVIPEALAAKEVAHTGLTKLHVVASMHERKAMMANLADGFVALPGGFGTFEELFEIVTWSQLGFHRKPVGILNSAGFFNPLVQFISHATASGFIKAEHETILQTASEPDELLEKLENWRPLTEPKWITEKSS